MATSFSLITMIITVIISLFSLPTSTLSSSPTLANVADTLMDSGYLSMALTLRLARYTTFKPDSRTLTVFAPSDSAFLNHGQPSLVELQYQISPQRLSLEALKNLSVGSKIPTFFSNQSLIVTSDKGSLRINGVVVQDSILFDDGWIIVYGVEDFFNSSFVNPDLAPTQSFSPDLTPQQSPNRAFDDSPAPDKARGPVPVVRDSAAGLGGGNSPGSSFSWVHNSSIIPAPLLEKSSSPSTFRGFGTNMSPSLSPAEQNYSVSGTGNSSQLGDELSGFGVDVFGQASNLLMSRGYSIMATFLDVQLLSTADNGVRMSVFAPSDEAMETYSKNMGDYSELFRRHIVPQLLSWTDLVNLSDGVMLPTISKGFVMTKTRSGDVLLLNGAPVVYPDMYYSNRLIVHGLDRLLVSMAKQATIGESLSELNDPGDQKSTDYEYAPP